MSLWLSTQHENPNYLIASIFDIRISFLIPIYAVSVSRSSIQLQDNEILLIVNEWNDGETCALQIQISLNW